MICDVFITTKGRRELFRRSLMSFAESTDPSLYRLTIIDDTGDGTSYRDVLTLEDYKFFDQHGLHVDHLFIHRENLGLGPSINQALSHIATLNGWYGHKTHGDENKVSTFVVYCQDDLFYSENWLEKLTTMFLLYEKTYNIGFASGVECIEHPARKDLGNGLLLKDWIRAAQMLGRFEYWMSMFPIPRFDVETGRVRAKPNDGMGSGVDWHFIRDDKNSVCKTGRTNLVIPGLVKHLGYADSTWLDRSLPESDADKLALQRISGP